MTHQENTNLENWSELSTVAASDVVVKDILPNIPCMHDCVLKKYSVKMKYFVSVT